MRQDGRRGCGPATALAADLLVPEGAAEVDVELRRERRHPRDGVPRQGQPYRPLSFGRVSYFGETLYPRARKHLLFFLFRNKEIIEKEFVTKTIFFEREGRGCMGMGSGWFSK